MINRENYEEYMMMHVDGELSLAEEQALKAFIKMHPELKSELEVYESARLLPDTTQVYVQKNTLLKPVVTKRIVLFTQWRRYGVAAGIAALLVFSVFKFMRTDKQGSEVVIINAHQLQVAPPVKSSDEKQKNGKVYAPVAPPQKQVNKEEVAARRNNGKKAMRLHRFIVIPAKQANSALQEPAVVTSKAIDALPIAVARSVQFTDIHIETHLAEKQIPDNIIVADSHTEKTFWDKLPVNEKSKKELKNVASAIAGTYEQINEVKKDLADKSITVKIEKRKLTISF